MSARRRGEVVATALAGSGLLAAALRSKPDSRRFYTLTLGAAGVWLAGGLRGRPLAVKRLKDEPRPSIRAVLGPVAIGAGAFAAFYVASLAVRRIPLLDDAVVGVLRYARLGTDPLVLATTLANGVCEELFFRGTAFTAFDDNHPVAASTGLYLLTTAATRNPALVLAAGVMGTLFSAQRQATGGVLAPMITHVTWSTLMLRYFPKAPLRAVDRRSVGTPNGI